VEVIEMAQYEVVYFEVNRIRRLVEADSAEEAIAKSEKLREEIGWEDCEEETEGTNGVERVYLNGEEVYSSGTVAGMVDAPEESELTDDDLSGGVA
jgi:hypothetical protein